MLVGGQFSAPLKGLNWRRVQRSGLPNRLHGAADLWPPPGRDQRL